MRPAGFPSLVLVALTLLLAACTGPTDTPVAASPAPSPAATSTPSPTPEPSFTPPDQAVGFTVRVPAGTPARDNIYLVLVPFYDWAETARIPLERGSDGTWTGAASVPSGGLVRYVYDRGWTPPSDMKATRERFDSDLPVEFRFLYAAPGLTEVRDTVSRWNDVAAEAPGGALQGVVTDARTGTPLREITVSVSGVHLGTYYDGFFQLDNVPTGTQRVTVLADDGRFRTQSREVVVEAGGLTTADFALEPAREVSLTFRARAPEDTPEWAAPRLTGSIPQLGSWVWYLNHLGPSPLRTLPMVKVGPGQFEARLTAYEGLYVQYAYTLGALGVGQEMLPNGEFSLRTALVPDTPTTVADTIGAWRTPGHITVEFRVRVPPNTPPGLPVLLDFNGPPTVMHQIGPLEWALPYYHPPGDGQYGLPYRYNLGGSLAGEVTVPDRVEATRSFVMPARDQRLDDTVERWRWMPPSDVTPPLAVDFYVAVPPDMLDSEKVFLLGDAPEMGAAQTIAPAPLEMTKLTETVWQATVSFATPRTVRYRFLGGRGQDTPGVSREYTADITYGGQQVLDWVSHWEGLVPPGIPPRSTFIAGAAIPDLWSDSYRILLPATLDRLKAGGVEWVDVSQIWNFARLEPTPLLENRSLRMGTLLTPVDDMRWTAGEVKARGMKLLIHPQPNGEMTPGVERFFEPHSREWYDAYLPQFERFMLDTASLAQEVGADMVAIPRVGVYGSTDPDFPAAFNARMEDIIRGMRAVYSGLLTSEGSIGEPLQYDYHRLLDYVGAYWFEPLDLPDDAPVEAFRAAVETRLDTSYKEASEKHGKPVVLLQFAYGSYAGAARLGPGGNPGGTEDQQPALDVATQARLYEAFFEAMASRPWVAGVFPFGYHLVDQPLDRDFSMRAKPAEAVTARWYEVLSP